jgi:uncharacterized protein YjbJ (UPF0337 family)
MSTDDKVRNAAEKAKGAVKETTGKVTGDRSLETEGRIDQSKADLKQAGEKVKDSLRD